MSSEGALDGRKAILQGSYLIKIVVVVLMYTNVGLEEEAYSTAMNILCIELSM